ncbi:hypothetical protein CPB86DRAFT_748230 [Serendipita vermifera]|nr:hypothetical protein CPB86DRAFT_748230 [Serendipita vermifera]
MTEYKPTYASYRGEDFPDQHPTVARSVKIDSENLRHPNPHRKYTKKWFGHAWDTAVEAGRWPRIIYLGFGLIVVGAWVGVMLWFAHQEVVFQRRNANQVNLRNQSIAQLSGQICAKGTLRKFDPDERSLRVSWSLLFIDVDSQGRQTLNDLGTTNDTTVAVNIYRDVRAVPEDRPVPAGINVDPQSLLRIDNTTLPPIAVLGVHPWDSVDTTIDFTQAAPDDAWKQPLFAYPFDRWVGSIILAAADRESATAANLSNSFVFPLADAMLADSTLNWRISASIKNTCEQDGVGCELHIEFTGRRPDLVVFAAIVAVIVNWASTIGIFLITCESVIMRRTYILREMDILGVCLTALFALPSVRAILPGAPDFGAIIDLIGIIPNIIIISVCTAIVAASRLRMPRPEKED